MKKLFYLVLMFLMLSMGSFTMEKSIIVNGCPDPYACWNMADYYSQQNYIYNTIQSSYAQDYDIWVWHYDYCMDGLWGPAINVNC